MHSTELKNRILRAIENRPDDISAYSDLLALCRETGDRATNSELRRLAAARIPATADPEGFYDVYKRSLLLDAPLSLDSYMLYLEMDREPRERFYQPRRHVLKRVVDEIQRLVDDELDELFWSQPPRTGKTTLLLILVTWLIGRDSEKSNLYSAFSDVITKAFYNGVLEMINDPITYKWHDVFPDAHIVQTNAADETINIDRKKRYPSLTCRSLYGTLNGACDCNGFLISDDLIGGIEEALNRDRMISAWSKVDNNLIPRTKQSAKILWCGTRWSMIDPAGLRLELVKNDPTFKDRRVSVINLPALNANDESNFEYRYGVGFDTQYYHERRASFERNNDMASWMAQYMGEPIEREGTLFTPDEFRFYDGTLPDEEPDRVFAAVDPAFGGGDFVAMPICVQYGDDVYVHDVVYSDEDKRITLPLIAGAVERNGVKALHVEATKALQSYIDELREELRRKGLYVNVTSKAAPTNVSKEKRIYDKAPDIRERMIFREDGHRDKAYSLFMQNVYSFKITGKNKHDDAPDSLAMAVDMAFGTRGRYEIFTRRF